MNNDEDDLVRDYRRASAAQAGEPGESTRRAILEGARAAARQRQPAANDARYAWGAVAGVAVLGIAVLLWRQSALPVPATASLPPAGTSASQPAAPEALAKAEAVADAEAVNAADARAAAPAPAALDPVAEKLRSRFPDAWTSASPPAVVWIIEDAQGNPLRQGALSPGELLPVLEAATSSRPATAAASAAAQSPPAANRAEGALSATGSAEAVQPGEAGWTMQTVLNSAGIPVRIATAKESR